MCVSGESEGVGGSQGEAGGGRALDIGRDQLRVSIAPHFLFVLYEFFMLASFALVLTRSYFLRVNSLCKKGRFESHYGMRNTSDLLEP